MHLTILLSWLIYYVIHSLLASNWMKGIVKAIAPCVFAYYRLGFNLISIIGLLLLLLQWKGAEQTILFQTNTLTLFLSGLLAGLGAYIAITAFRNYNLMEFAGLRSEQPNQTNMLQTSGWNQVVRHPLYLGTVLVVLGIVLAYPTDSVMSIALATFGYLPIGIWLEERKLIAEFGAAYTSYQKQVKALIPGIW